MAVDVNLKTITAGYSLSSINENFGRIADALQDSVSRTGNTPNQMNADLDMNSNNLLNIKNLDVDGLTVNGVIISANPTGITAGDKGDIIVSGGDVWTIDALVVDNGKIGNGAVTFNKLNSGLVQTDSDPRDDTTDVEVPTVKRVATMIADIPTPASSDILTPETFGCVGDGVTDDTANFLLALNNAQSTGRILYLTAKKTYLLSTWSSTGVIPTDIVKIRGPERTAKVKGPSGAGYFLRPGQAFDIDGVDFDRWTGVIRKDVADGGNIIGARFTNNTLQNITGIPFNIECPFKYGHISGNYFTACSGGYMIRVGENTNANQDTWDGYFIQRNVMKTNTATSTTSGFPILATGIRVLVSDNVIDGFLSDAGEAVAIYAKLRYSQIVNNRINGISSTQNTGAALDVAGISLKGAIRGVTNSGINGFKNIVSGNTITNIGAQGVKGSGIRCQVADSIVENNIVQDCGLIFISADDTNGTSYNKILNNSCEAFNILPTWGIYLTTFGTSHKIIGNTIKDATIGILITSTSNSLLDTLVSGNSINTTRASSYAFYLGGSTGIAGVMITGNGVQLPSTGTVLLNNGTVTRVNVRNNDFAVAIAAGAALSTGSTSGITFTGNP